MLLAPQWRSLFGLFLNFFFFLCNWQLKNHMLLNMTTKHCKPIGLFPLPMKRKGCHNRSWKWFYTGERKSSWSSLCSCVLHLWQKKYFPLVDVFVKHKSMMVCCKGLSPGILFLCGEGRIWNKTSCGMVKWKIKVLWQIIYQKNINLLRTVLEYFNCFCWSIYLVTF